MIQNIWAVGRNYADHAKELGNAVPTAAPLIFLKAGTTATESETVQLPAWTEDVHHEIELALRLNSKLEIEAVGLALDLTERKKQNELKSQGQPWTLAKSFTNSCPLSSFKTISSATEWHHFSIELHVDGQLRQKGSVNQMIFPIPFLLDHIKSYFPVTGGDVILTGTPAGVGPLLPGQTLKGELFYQGQSWIQKSWHFRR